MCTKEHTRECMDISIFTYTYGLSEAQACTHSTYTYKKGSNFSVFVIRPQTILHYRQGNCTSSPTSLCYLYLGDAVFAAAECVGKRRGNIARGLGMGYIFFSDYLWRGYGRHTQDPRRIFEVDCASKPVSTFLPIAYAEWIKYLLTLRGWREDRAMGSWVWRLVGHCMVKPRPQFLKHVRYIASDIFVFTY